MVVDMFEHSEQHSKIFLATPLMVTNFYDNVTRECPCRKLAVFVYGQKQPVKFLEKTLIQYHQQIKLENPTVIIGPTSFENLQPKNVKLKFQVLLAC